ncbi:hypothetical protein BGW36DRAFT_333671 [Talaromyces proteolyticus]|uniref:PCI domain-containing protein n=1 Tax=Talaromyces proteolyticus TaxID=1131652 RepID=A0AAD4L226_9EURO|nr:uncharacterized protein BGW36DRAFT_333671 [Talaromyces proteolyticus]KAH8703074.1 hypothetical protein BGW36DRAFT_333671 [Talaromyces proteolyticus]
MATSMLDQFLSGISQVVAHRQGDDLRELLQVLPERMRDGYRAMAIELRANYPSGPGDEALLKRCEALVPKTTEGTTWPAFPIFIRSYLAYLRDGNISNQLEAYKALNGVLYQCMQALGDSQMGAIVLRTVIYLSQVVAGLAMALENDPELLRKLRADEPQDAFERSNLVEDAANVVREGFIKCLTDRVGTTGTKGRPEGKRAGVYLMVNQCLKLLHRCGSLRGADTIFKSISAQSAPLSFYPAAQRVTYLYYLGLYLFSNNQFFLAHKALWESYMQCHVNCYQQKRHILIHLISCNIVMGRFPSLTLLQKPEARDLSQIFIPLCKLICSGDYLSFRDHFRQGSPTAEWYIKNGLLYQIRNRCELLVWRSLIRKVFIYGGFHGDPTAQRSPPPMLHLSKLETAVRFIQARHSGHIGAATLSSIETNGFSDVFTLHTSRDSDYDVITDFPSTLSASRDATDDADYLYPPGYYDQNGVFVENSDGQRVPGHEDEEYAGNIGDLVPYSNDHSEIEHTSRLLRDLESIVASLINQNLLGGYLTHNPARFVIPGAKHVGAMAKGFPNVWQTISSQQERHGNVVPAWVIAPQSAFDQPALTSAAGGSRVVNLTGAKAVGS